MRTARHYFQTKPNIGRCLFAFAFAIVIQPLSIRAADPASELDDLAAVADVKSASQLASKLQSMDSVEISAVLGAMKNASPTGKNWLLSVAQTLADRDNVKSKDQLQSFLQSTDEQDPSARYWAFDYVTSDQPEARKQFLRSHLDDPSLDIRFEAIELALKELASAEEASESAKQLPKLKQMLELARLPEQIQAINKELEELDAEVDLLKHFGFVAEWQLLGPFENADQSAFDKVYEPEAAYIASKLDLEAGVQGKNGEVTWDAITTEEENGALKIADALAKEKGAVAYLIGTFDAGSAMDCELRIGTPNATKVWVNGELVVSREVYHSGNQIDQYTAPVKLKAGSNSIFVKSCQNEQTQPWAQDWEFQLRFTDASGAAIKQSE